MTYVIKQPWTEKLVWNWPRGGTLGGLVTKSNARRLLRETLKRDWNGLGERHGCDVILSRAHVLRVWRADCLAFRDNFPNNYFCLWGVRSVSLTKNLLDGVKANQSDNLWLLRFPGIEFLFAVLFELWSQPRLGWADLQPYLYSLDFYANVNA